MAQARHRRRSGRERKEQNIKSVGMEVRTHRSASIVYTCEPIGGQVSSVGSNSPEGKSRL